MWGRCGGDEGAVVRQGEAGSRGLALGMQGVGLVRVAALLGGSRGPGVRPPPGAQGDQSLALPVRPKPPLPPP